MKPPRYKAPAKRHRFTDMYLRNLKPEDRGRMIWDTVYPGLGILVTARGVKSFKVVYYNDKKLVWYTVGRYPSIGLAFARTECIRIRQLASQGRNAHKEKIAALEQQKQDEAATLEKQKRDQGERNVADPFILHRP